MGRYSPCSGKWRRQDNDAEAVSNLLPAERGQVSAGTIRFEGVDIARQRPGDLVRAGLVQVLEGRHCFRSLTVEENLVSGGIGRSASGAEIKADLERVYGYFQWQWGRLWPFLAGALSVVAIILLLRFL
ncbi:hypothetical protein SAMN05518861_12088 [Mesorhizobium sp. YR577]|nr:hypothetical protein SAMN05518861_12088 [Mesorhizobium sp. YR577]